MLSEELFQKFSDLVDRLSPENLACDGEISVSQQRLKQRQIWREWKTLEAQAGRKVTDDEIENELIKRFQES